MEKPKITSFEDLFVYQCARAFKKEIMNLAKSLPLEEKYILIPQMKRAALSITNNIAEGYGRYHYQEHLQFSRQARGSAYELVDDLNHCLDEGYITPSECDAYKSKAYSLIRIMNSFIKSTRKIQQEHILRNRNER